MHVKLKLTGILITHEIYIHSINISNSDIKNKSAIEKSKEIHLYHSALNFGFVETRGNSFHQANHDEFKARSIGVVMENEVADRVLRAAKRGRSHARIDCAQVIVQRVQVLQEVFGGWAEDGQDLVVAGLDAEFEEELAEQLEDGRGGKLEDFNGRHYQRVGQVVVVEYSDHEVAFDVHAGFFSIKVIWWLTESERNLHSKNI